MSLPSGCAKGDNGFVFIRRLRGELQSWSDVELRDRLCQVTAHMTADGGGLEWRRSYTRAVAVSERKALVAEIDRRARPDETRA